MTKTFTVYHITLSAAARERVNAEGWNACPAATAYADAIMNGDVTKALSERLYTRVADVAAEDLDTVYRLTNHIDHDWRRNRAVTAKPGRHRSTSVGDIIRDGDGNAFAVVGLGFDELSADQAAGLPKE